MKKENFCHLHVHSYYSLLDGVSKPIEIAKKAKKMNHQYIACTDHGNIDGVIEFQKACIQEGITPIIGCESYVVKNLDTKEKPGHITFLVKNDEGWKNLCSLLTFANLHGFYRRPRMTFQKIKENCRGLVIMSACAGSFLRLKSGINFFKDISELTDTFLEIMPHDIPEQKQINDICIGLNKQYKNKLVTTYDSHFIDPEDSKVQEVLLAIQRKSTWNDPNRWKFNINDLFLCDQEYLLNKFQKNKHITHLPLLKLKQAIRNTVKIAKLCSGFKINTKPISLPSPKQYPYYSSNYNLRRLCFEGYRDIFKEDIKKNKLYYKRFNKELKVIMKLNLSDYFLIVFDLLNWCRENDIALSTGRGSSSGSLIAFLLKITTIDPIKYNLIFERFLNVDRGDMADIDIDIPDIKREEVRQYLIDKYGENNISGVSTFMKMKSRGVIRDVSRVFEVPLKEVDVIAKAIGNQETIPDVLEKEEGIRFQQQYPEVIEVAQKLEGTIRGASQHASAIIISKKDLTTSGQCYLAKRKGVIVVNWAKNEAENQGLLKLDLLGLNQLSIIKETQDLIKENYPDIKLPDLNYLNPDDENIFRMLSDGDTAGIFQMNTPHITKFVTKMGIDNFSNMIDVVALVRPGPLESGMADEYIERKHGKKWEKVHPIYEDITKNSYGQAIFQEDLMFVITRMAGLPFTIADKIRKIIGKKRDVKEMLPYKNMFIQGCLGQKTFSENEANDFWQVMENASHYLFNRSHSVAYAHLGYQTAWLKYYYPIEFLCANMTLGKEEKKEELIKWGFQKGIKIQLPKIGKSDAIKWKIKENVIYAPFIEIKGIGEESAKKAALLKKARQLSFFNIYKEKETSLDGMLESVGAFTDDIPKTAQSYFSFPISDDIKITNPNLFSFLEKEIKNKNIENNDLLKGKFIPKKAVRRITPSVTKGIEKLKTKVQEHVLCKDCGIKDQARQPVSLVLGKYNILIIGEAAGFKEDLKNEPFVGDSGKILWRELKQYKNPFSGKKFIRTDFCISNVCKCYPSLTKTPSKKEIQICLEYLKQEISIIQPKLILAFGNTNLMAFLGKKSGIMKESGETNWNEKYKAWITFCLHPASVLYHEENYEMFSEGIYNFVNLIKGEK